MQSQKLKGSDYERRLIRLLSIELHSSALHTASSLLFGTVFSSVIIDSPHGQTFSLEMGSSSMCICKFRTSSIFKFHFTRFECYTKVKMSKWIYLRCVHFIQLMFNVQSHFIKFNQHKFHEVYISSFSWLTYMYILHKSSSTYCSLMYKYKLCYVHVRTFRYKFNVCIPLSSMYIFTLSKSICIYGLWLSNATRK